MGWFGKDYTDTPRKPDNMGDMQDKAAKIGKNAPIAGGAINTVNERRKKKQGMYDEIMGNIRGKK